MNFEDSSEPSQAELEQASDESSPMSDERYRLTHPSQIGTVLRDLAWQKCIVNVHARSGHDLVTTVLHVDPAARSFVFDWSRSETECEALLESSENAFSASLRGVPVNFVIGKPAATDFQGGPAFVASFPEKLYHFQRRRHFRARTLVTKGYSCELRTPKGQAMKLDIADLSLSGVGLRSKALGVEQLPSGAVLEKCVLDFRELGKLTVNLQVVGHWAVSSQNGGIYHFGCAFSSLDGRLENFLQRLVFQLELAHRG
ncbi:flagellar brake protein [Cupriavidus sp. USMAHM13]|uniref:flagellar brake protein n=1 Tax=Cupriavidus sp. USMAHM13 TaxID=1389192 RepID=UPI0008A67F35|nr:flagellar brake protein [Cupriavidus sp. USMAHM13]AOZ01892.1 flagellar brake protein [Cupriavidus sp. USMAHM13]